MSAPREVASRLAPSGVRRAGVDMSNVLLVTGGVPGDTARTVAGWLGVPVEPVSDARPSQRPDAAAAASGRVAGSVAGHTARGPSAAPTA
jgi:hypothetical protein